MIILFIFLSALIASILSSPFGLNILLFLSWIVYEHFHLPYLGRVLCSFPSPFWPIFPFLGRFFFSLLEGTTFHTISCTNFFAFFRFACKLRIYFSLFTLFPPRLSGSNNSPLAGSSPFFSSFSPFWLEHFWFAQFHETIMSQLSYQHANSRLSFFLPQTDIYFTFGSFFLFWLEFISSPPFWPRIHACNC